MTQQQQQQQQQQPEIYQRLENHFHSDMAMLELNRGFRKLSLFFFSFRLPFLWIRSAITRLIRLITPQLGNRLSASYIKRFYRLFFMYQGMSYYWAQEKPPKNPTKPYIIITMRYDYLSALYLYSILDDPIIIPFTNIFTGSVRANYPANGVAPHMDSMTYDDAPLTHTTEQIRTLLNNGYPAVVHLNHGLGNMFETDSLFIHQGLFDILDWDVDIYFLAMDGYENRRYSTAFKGTLITCLMQTKETLFSRATPDNRQERIRLITEFFGFMYYTIVPD
jgi:hypothetical protein